MTRGRSKTRLSMSSPAGKAVRAAAQGDCHKAKQLINDALFKPKAAPFKQFAKAARFVVDRCGAFAGAGKRRRRRRK